MAATAIAVPDGTCALAIARTPFVLPSAPALRQLFEPGRLRWPASIPADLGRCLDSVLAGARFNCPLSGAAIVDAGLSLAVRGR